MALFLRTATIALAAGCLAALTSCTSTPPPPHDEGAILVSTQKGVPGGARSEIYTSTVVVTAIDAGSRKLTLLRSDGTQSTYVAGPEVVNFDQIRVGDHVKATVAQELAVFLRKSGEKSADGESASIALAPVGAKPGAAVARTTEVTAKVTLLDPARRRATLLFPDGTSRTYTVRPDVDLTKVSTGQEVVIRVTEGVALSVEKP